MSTAQKKVSNMNQGQAILFVAATPLGNLSDASFRLKKTLEECTHIICEDTRRSKKLLSHFGISSQGKKWISYQDYSEKSRSEEVVDLISKDQGIAVLMSDAGTPCIADPGYRLVKKAYEKNLLVSPLPGPSAITSLLSVSGLPSDQFQFVGFLPRKKQDLIEKAKTWCMTTIFFDSLRRLVSNLKNIQSIHPDAYLVIGRELSKLHEEIFRGDIQTAIHWLETKQTLKGEVSVIFSPSPTANKEFTGKRKNLDETDESIIWEQIRIKIKKGANIKEILQSFGPKSLHKLSRQTLYAKFLEIKQPPEKK